MKPNTVSLKMSAAWPVVFVLADSSSGHHGARAPLREIQFLRFSLSRSKHQKINLLVYIPVTALLALAMSGFCALEVISRQHSFCVDMPFVKRSYAKFHIYQPKNKIKIQHHLKVTDIHPALSKLRPSKIIWSPHLPLENG
jgi:hypothetical protein